MALYLSPETISTTWTKVVASYVTSSGGCGGWWGEWGSHGPINDRKQNNVQKKNILFHELGGSAVGCSQGHETRRFYYTCIHIGKTQGPLWRGQF